jgi:hypothetical protein
MTRIFLVIKGTRVDAIMQSKVRKIAIEIDGESDSFTEVYCYASVADRDKIIAWYAEDAGIAKPCLPGELLWYAERPIML